MFTCHDCHEFIFHFSHDGRVELDRLALGVPYQDASNVTRWRAAGGGTRCRALTQDQPTAPNRQQPASPLPPLPLDKRALRAS